MAKAWVNGVLKDVEDTTSPGQVFAKAKQRRLIDAAAVYAQKIAAGFTYDGHTYQLGPDKIGSTGVFNITAKGSSAKVSIDDPTNYQWPADFKFIDKDNVGVAMTAAEMLAFAKAADAYVTAVRERYWSLRVSIAAAADANELAAIDITTGWP